MENRSFRKGLAVGVVALFLGASVIPSVIGDNSSFGKTIYVDDDNTEGPWYGSQEYPYQYIQEGIDNATVGDTVYVYNGTYYEEVLINTSITLQGEDANSTIIEGEITIFSGHTNICYFSIHNRRMYGEAIILRGHRGAKFCTISHNIISNNHVGIHCELCNNIKIKNNNILNNSYGVLLAMGNSTTVSNNNIFNNEKGIVLDLYSINNLIKRNNIFSNEMGICCCSLCNRITSNNLINNSVNAYACTRLFICRMIPIPFIGRPNLWYKNYWSDWDGKGLMVIKGEFLLGFYAINEFFTIPINSYDWHPAKEPYDIDA